MNAKKEADWLALVKKLNQIRKALGRSVYPEWELNTSHYCSPAEIDYLFRDAYGNNLLGQYLVDFSDPFYIVDVSEVTNPPVSAGTCFKYNGSYVVPKIPLPENYLQVSSGAHTMAEYTQWMNSMSEHMTTCRAYGYGWYKEHNWVEGTWNPSTGEVLNGAGTVIGATSELEGAVNLIKARGRLNGQNYNQDFYQKISVWDSVYSICLEWNVYTASVSLDGMIPRLGYLGSDIGGGGGQYLETGALTYSPFTKSVTLLDGTTGATNGHPVFTDFPACTVNEGFTLDFSTLVTPPIAEGLYCATLLQPKLIFFIPE